MSKPKGKRAPRLDTRIVFERELTDVSLAKHLEDRQSFNALPDGMVGRNVDIYYSGFHFLGLPEETEYVVYSYGRPAAWFNEDIWELGVTDDRVLEALKLVTV